MNFSYMWNIIYFNEKMDIILGKSWYRLLQNSVANVIVNTFYINKWAELNPCIPVFVP